MKHSRSSAAEFAVADSWQAWVIVLASFIAIAICNGANYISVVALKPIAAEFDWPRAIPALCYSLSMLGMGIGGIIMGRWSDRIGVAFPAAFGMLMVAAGAWLASSSNDMWQLWLAHGLLIGLLGNSALFAPLLANTTRWFERRRGLAIAVVASGQALSGTLWPPLLRYLVDTQGWRTTFVLFAASVLCIALPSTLLLRRRPPGYQPPHYQPPGGQLPVAAAAAKPAQILGLAPALVMALLCTAIIGCCVAMSMPMVHVVAHATDLGYPGARAAEILTLLLGCSFISRLLWGLAADRIGGLLTLLLGSICQALCLLAFTRVDSLTGLYIVAALFGLGYGGIIPSYTLIIREHFPATGIGWRIGMIILYGTLGMALGGWLGAYIFDLTQSYASAFLIGIAFNVGNLIIVAFLVWRLWMVLPPPELQKGAELT